MPTPDSSRPAGPSDQTRYDVFISYARRNNAPILDAFPHGWVTAIRDHILAKGKVVRLLQEASGKSSLVRHPLRPPFSPPSP